MWTTHNSSSCKWIKRMIGAISVIGTRWLHHIQILETTVQEASGELNNCSYSTKYREKGVQLWTLLLLWKWPVRVYTEGNWNHVQCIVKALVGYYCISLLYCIIAEFVDDGLYEAQFLIVFFTWAMHHIATAQSTGNIFCLCEKKH